MPDDHDHLQETAPLEDEPGFEPEDETTRSITPIIIPELENPNAVLIVFAENPRALHFELNDEVILGRRSESDLRLDVDLAPYGGFPAGVSRQHVNLKRTPAGILLTDMESRNGTFLNGKQLKAGEAVPVSNGQSVRFGHLLGWIYFGEAVENHPES